ncbi:hypothetical protein FCOIX_1530 [Fusarium coicis]|nr:hypothetical protein FCOIX_1530 [Fusarium coicis]
MSGLSNSPLPSPTLTTRPSSSDSIARSDHRGCIDLDDEQPQCYRSNKDEKTQRNGEAGEEHLDSSACRLIVSNDLDSPIHDIHAHSERSTPSHESDLGGASPAPTKKPRTLEDWLLETGASLQRPSQDFGWDRMESDLVFPGYLGESYYASPANPPRTQETSSANPKKRKLDSPPDEGYVDSRLKRRGIHAYDTRGDTFKPIAISLTLSVAAKNREETWKYEWDSEQQCWYNKAQHVKELRREKACEILEFLIIQVKPTSGLPPVSLKATSCGNFFRGLDKNDGRQYIIKSETMLEMIQKRTAGQGSVTSYKPFYR